MDWRFCGDKARSKKSRHTRDGEILRLLHNWNLAKGLHTHCLLGRSGNEGRTESSKENLFKATDSKNTKLALQKYWQRNFSARVSSNLVPRLKQKERIWQGLFHHRRSARERCDPGENLKVAATEGHLVRAFTLAASLALESASPANSLSWHTH